MKFYKKIISSILAVAIFLPGVFIGGDHVFAVGDWDCHIGISPAIQQYPDWCWATSGQMMLREYLVNQNRLQDTESIYKKYGEKCINISNKYTGEHRSTEEFERLFTNFWNAYGGNKERASEVNTDDINKETAFLVYLCSDRLSTTNRNDVFKSGLNDEIQTFVDVVLEAAELENAKCLMFVQPDLTRKVYGLSNDEISEKIGTAQQWAMGLIYFAVNNCNSPLVVGDKFHYSVINGIYGDSLYTQDTGGQQETIQNLGYFTNNSIFLFIGNTNVFDDSTKQGKFTSIFCQNSENLKKDDKVYVMLNSQADRVFLQDDTGKEYYEFSKVCKSMNSKQAVEYNIVDKNYSWYELYIYQMVVLSKSKFTKLSDLKDLKFVDKVRKKVYYNLNGGTIGQSVKNADGYNEQESTNKVIVFEHSNQCILSSAFNPTRAGYNFKGWAEENSESKLHAPGTKCSELTSYKLKAVWEKTKEDDQSNSSGGANNTGTPGGGDNIFGGSSSGSSGGANNNGTPGGGAPSGSSGNSSNSSNSGGGVPSGSTGNSSNSSSSGGGVPSGSSGNSSSLNNNSTNNTLRASNSVASTSFPILTRYSYNQAETKPISAEQAISLALENSKDAFSLTKIEEKNNKAIVFETNKNNEKGEKENLAKWTIELDKLNKEFATNYDEKKVLEAKQSLTTEEQTKLAEINNTISKFNFKLQVNIPTIESAPSIPQKAKESLKSKDAIVVDFLENGIFPGQMKVDLKLGKDKANKKYIVYYLLPADEKNSKSIVQLLSKEIIVNNEGYVRFVADRGADYIFIPVTDENLANVDKFTELLEN